MDVRTSILACALCALVGGGVGGALGSRLGVSWRPDSPLRSGPGRPESVRPAAAAGAPAPGGTAELTAAMDQLRESVDRLAASLADERRPLDGAASGGDGVSAMHRDLAALRGDVHALLSSPGAMAAVPIASLDRRVDANRVSAIIARKVAGEDPLEDLRLLTIGQAVERLGRPHGVGRGDPGVLWIRWDVPDGEVILNSVDGYSTDGWVSAKH